MPNARAIIAGLVPLGLVLSLQVSAVAQTTPEKTTARLAKINLPPADPDSDQAQRQAFAISIVTTLADEARSYRDLSLRPRVLAQAADTIWTSDRETGRRLFRRAWEAAETADAAKLDLDSGTPAMVTALKKSTGRDLRSEVLNIVAGRDHTLGEEFLTTLRNEKRQTLEDEANRNEAGHDNWSPDAASAKRLQLARALLDRGELDAAIRFGAPALTQVNLYSIGFLSALRRQSAELADQMFAALLAQVQLDPGADANTASGLSSYVITPGLYVVFNSDGGARWSQPDQPLTPPDLSPTLRDRFIRTCAGILLRPLPPVDQDFSSAGRAGRMMVVTRLLPYFEKYSPDIAVALRTQLAQTRERSGSNGDGLMLTQGIQADESAGNALNTIQEKLDHAKSSTERDRICAETAVILANENEERAQAIADKIEDADRRAQVRRYVDLQLIKLAAVRKDTAAVVRLARTGQLTHAQRSWAYIQAAKLQSAAELRTTDYLNEALKEAENADAGDGDRARVLIGIANQFIASDITRAWEILNDAVRAANASERFKGENEQLSYSVPSRNGIRLITIGAEDFNFTGVLRPLSKRDLYRSLDLAKSFKYDAARANATLAVARSVLEK